ALPNGINLIPYQVVDRLPNDAQLATLLADKIACLLEKQPVALPLTDADLGLEAAEITTGILVPGAGLAMDVYGLSAGISANKQIRLNEQQRERVTLDLLHDAGYDITQAPLAWWLMA